MDSGRSLKLPAFYPIVDASGGDDAAIDHAVSLTRILASPDAQVRLIQLRAKNVAAGAVTALAETLVATLSTAGARLIINDRADVAAAASAAGVHLGDQDLEVADARRLLGRSAIIGYSTHSLDEVHAAQRSGADYLGFGPVFASPTKAGEREPHGLEALAAACEASALPIVAIGGITLETAPRVWAAGAASVAVISDLARSADPAALARAYARAAHGC